MKDFIWGQGGVTDMYVSDIYCCSRCVLKYCLKYTFYNDAFMLFAGSYCRRYLTKGKR